MGKIQYYTINKFEYCGCPACTSSCPVDAIIMKEDREGFLYPVISSDKCIQCFVCLQVCPLKENRGIGFDSMDLVYAARVKDRNMLLKSSSGGIFVALCQKYISKNHGVICAIYDYNKHEVNFHLCKTMEECLLARGSKYIASNLNYVLKESKEWLKSNKDKKILFVGTGCQADGFRKYMEREKLSNRVFIVDLICMGVPSSKIWKDYIHKLEETHNGRVSYINFKDKRKGWNRPTSIAVINDQEYSLDSYSKIFYDANALRPSCYHCQYNKIKRKTDMTIGDYWGIEAVFPEFYDNMGNSLVIIHSERGKNLFNDLRNTINFKRSKSANCLQPRLLSPIEEPKTRKRFWNEYFLFGIEYTIKKYGYPSIKEIFFNKKRNLFHRLRHF